MPAFNPATQAIRNAISVASEEDWFGDSKYSVPLAMERLQKAITARLTRWFMSYVAEHKAVDETPTFVTLTRSADFQKALSQEALEVWKVLVYNHEQLAKGVAQVRGSRFDDTGTTIELLSTYFDEWGPLVETLYAGTMPEFAEYVYLQEQ